MTDAFGSPHGARLSKAEIDAALKALQQQRAALVRQLISNRDCPATREHGSTYRDLIDCDAAISIVEIMEERQALTEEVARVQAEADNTMHTNATADEPLLTTAEVARLTGRSVSTLEKDRLLGTGPDFCRIGRQIRYRACDVRAWLDSFPTVATTREAKAAAGGARG